LSLTLKNGGVLKQKSSNVTFASGDSLYVAGVNNTILVKKLFTINGSFTMAKESELTFEFDETEQDPTVYFAPLLSGIIEIAEGAKLIFKGKGTVKFADGTSIKLMGTYNGKRSELILQDSSKLTLDENAVFTLRGDGRFSVEKDAQVYIGSGRQFVLGYYPHDSAEVVVDGNGEVVLDGTLSFVHGTYSLDFLRNSKLTINNGGVFEINSRNEQPSSTGLLSRFTFQEGTVLKIVQGGKLLIYKNITQYRGPEIPFTWNNIKSSIITGGQVGFVGTDFIGTLQNNLSAPVSVTAVNFVDLVINRMPSLSVTTLFNDESGNQKIRTKDGVVVSLLTGDTVDSDDATTGTVFVLNDGEFFEITSQGVRS
jgi:hypothetical protein